MRIRALVVASLLCAQCKYSAGGNIGELVFVQAIWRHGDRAPGKLPYPNDIHTEKDWPRGWSQLTNLGMQQLYDLGMFFRKRYGDFIGERFNLKDVMVVSTDSDRAIVSAQAMLRGLFPARNGDVWMECEQWQPLPFHSRTLGDADPLLRPTDYECPLYDDVVDKQNRQLNSKINEEYADVFKYLEKVTGFKKVDFDTAKRIDNIQREVVHGMKQPSWTAMIWPSHNNLTTLEILSELHRIERMAEFDSPEKAKLRGGLLLGDWLERSLKVANGTQKKPKKMLLYSTHDGTVTALQFAMGVSNGRLVPYAACIIMELYRNAEKELEARLYYKNETFSDTLHRIVVPKCGEVCLVEKLVQTLSSQTFFTEKELRKRCKSSSAREGSGWSSDDNDF